MAGRLGTSQTFEITLLSQDKIAEVVRSAGLQGPPELVQAIVIQARGRAGLATTLAWLCLSGQVAQVARGDALLEDTIGSYRSILDAGVALLLAVISISGDDGIEESTLKSILGISRLELSRLLTELGHSGTVEEVTSYDRDIPQITVQPEPLRYAAVHDQFFRTTGSPSYKSIVNALPNPTSALIPLIGAAHRGAEVDRSMIQELLCQDGPERAVRAYASLGPKEARYCLDTFPQYSIQIAQELLGIAPETSIPILLHAAVDDSRPLSSNPDHPLRLIKDYVGIPQDSVSRRRTVISAVSQWLEEGGDTDAAITAASAALRVDWETLQAEPGSGNVITIRSGLVSIEVLKESEWMWQEVLNAFVGHQIQNFSPLLEALHGLCYPGRYGSVEPEGEWSILARRTAKQVITQLVRQYPDRPGMHHHLRNLKKHLGARVRIPKHPDFETLFPQERFVATYDPELQRRLERRQKATAIRLAARWLKDPAREVANRLVELEREAATVEITWPRLSPIVAEELAHITNDPATFARILLEERAPGDLLDPFVGTIARDKPNGWVQLINLVLSDGQYSYVGVIACLTEDVGPKIRQRAVALCDWRLKTWLEFSPVTLSEDVLASLLVRDDETIVSAVVVRLGVHRTDEMTDTLRPIWEDALVTHSGDEYWIGLILSRNLELLAKWIRIYIERASSKSWKWERIPDNLLQGVAKLPLATRLDLLTFLAPRDHLHFGAEMVYGFIGKDPETEELIFTDRRLENYRRVLLNGTPNQEWLRPAVLALRSWMEPEEIASSTMWGLGHTGWTGNASDTYSRYLQAFSDLGSGSLGPEERKIVEAGERVFLRWRDRALEKEHKDSVYGR